MTAANHLDTYEKSIRRIAFLILILGPIGAIVAGVMKGPSFGFGFLLGAMLSALSFWRWKKVVDALGGASSGHSRTFWTIRLALLVGAGYVIVKYLEVSAAALFCGLLVSSVAVIISIVYELIYGT
jgi:hypothetical protein